MSFLGILGGFETHQKQFFEIFEAKEQKEKTVKNRKISVEISYRSPPKYRKFCSLLVTRLLKARYYPHNSFLASKFGHNPSFVWRGIWNSMSIS